MKTEFKACGGCTGQITDRYIFEVSGCNWHGSCLRCTVCFCSLARLESCYYKDGAVYCKQDYIQKFKTACAKCSRTISATDWVRRARDFVFHLACFACDSCGRQLSTGEQFAISDERVLCKTHYMELIDDGTTSSEDGCDAEGSSSGKSKTKRIRTTFTEEQIQILQAYFHTDINPDGQTLEKIAEVTGLTKRVTQVWFQNARARQKRHVPQGQELFSGLQSDLNNNSNSSNDCSGGSGPSPPPPPPSGGGCIGLAKTASIFNHHGYINLMV